MDTTFVRLLQQHAASRPLAPALREKEYGIWQTTSWGALAERVRLLAAGLAAAGLQRGQHLAVIGDNRPRLYATIRPGARYYQSMRLLDRVKQLDPAIFTKSGMMVGLGEGRPEVLQVMDDLRVAEVDFLTLGQYLQPTRKHHPVIRFVPPDEFKSFEVIGRTKGFLLVSASPLTRSSHHAGEDFAKLQAARQALHAH